ncbi:2-succinyl-6-hydroxy-2,4-cyclohexadiene-1-carboxylate synthase [Phocoenobacter uteri]|uniref:Putative 2-succinyl-6-hydroxy-2,4-cyclohexadiene-1-carboxylate synthase n=1 Tax=Phocoenobacter uteri TaxID=146806 RepID=A0A379CCM4_9PAST|nr:2-succinyl-6-hydroxy-2,4-cyclohexadiene-1-carboxylate synthase [Phocoenobacter uteri]MDG6881792.1 2-succinyl-6-hydroxy-2,4-cyclohexadiene-1-carboxylate synthase [Phocoenobacter uteri]SUB59829.1 2-succinyl-6-hydroxy-2,4-cyclohexadiene-1-carboxylate synthase [Phocoenobacter uteri]
MLAFQWHNVPNLAEPSIPVVFLHGLLGSQQDWNKVLKNLQNHPKIRPLTLDLPFHGQSETICCNDFNEVCQQIHDTLQTQIDRPFYLVGYSLGGRIALHYHLFKNNPLLLGTIVEGANIGLETKSQRYVRWQNDIAWATRFETENIENVLQDWYQQAVFFDLDFAKKQQLIQKRKSNNGKCIAQMLKATSLAKQAFLLEQIKTQSNLHFIIGERDKKFQTQAIQYQLNYQLIENAGHNCHWENPVGFIKKLETIVR